MRVHNHQALEKTKRQMCQHSAIGQRKAISPDVVRQTLGLRENEMVNMCIMCAEKPHYATQEDAAEVLVWATKKQCH